MSLSLSLSLSLSFDLLPCNLAPQVWHTKEVQVQHALVTCCTACSTALVDVRGSRNSSIQQHGDLLCQRTSTPVI